MTPISTNARIGAGVQPSKKKVNIKPGFLLCFALYMASTNKNNWARILWGLWSHDDDDDDDDDDVTVERDSDV
jgi:hypothetical protein